MLPRDVDLRLADILKAARKILTHTAGMDADALTTDDWALDAVLHNLAVIGEAAARLPQSFTDGHSSVAWGEMRDLRNLVIHEYLGVDIDIIWNTIQEDLPELVRDLERIFPDA